jgi:hypothetical protein
MDKLCDLHEAILAQNFKFGDYVNQNEKESLKEALKSAHGLKLKQLKISPPANLSLQPLKGIPLYLGISYGGPACFEPLTGEILTPLYKDYPASSFHRIITIFHEVSHACGYLDDTNASILQYILLMKSNKPLFKAMGALMFLSYTHLYTGDYLNKLTERYPHLRPLVEDLFRASRDIEKTKEKFPTSLLSALFENSNLKNKRSKYGYSQNQDYFKFPFYQVAWKLNQLEILKSQNVKAKH